MEADGALGVYMEMKKALMYWVSTLRLFGVKLGFALLWFLGCVGYRGYL